MNLIRFKPNPEFDSLRTQMRAEYIELSTSHEWNNFDPREFIESLRIGKEISFDEVKICEEDGTLELNGIKILVYIRDQGYNHGYGYKFHIANCQTLQTARNQNRYERYVASINTNGIFKINVNRGGRIEKDKEVRLNVCKNCLQSLNYKGYNKNRQRIYSEFSLDEFFKLYPGTNIVTPRYNNATAPLNDYPDDFSRISNQVRERNQWRCEHCRLDLSNRNHRRFLHAHHRNGRRDDNRLENLECLCIRCHAQKPGHRMEHSPDYIEFERTFPSSLFSP